MDKAMREQKTHGESGFPIAHYERTGLDAKGTIVECHWHEEWEIFYVMEGETVFTVNGRGRLLQKGDLAFIPGNSMHIAEALGETGCHFRDIVFSMSLVQSLFEDDTQTRYILPLCQRGELEDAVIFQNGEGSGSLGEGFQRLYELLETRPRCYELKVKGALFSLLAELLCEADLSGGSRIFGENAQRIQEAIGYLEEHLRDKVTLSQLAAAVSMSPGHFGRQFRRMTGKTPVEYLMELRLRHAAELLGSTDRQVLEIALDAGFNNMGHFIRSFEKKIGCSPRKYRSKQPGSF